LPDPPKKKLLFKKKDEDNARMNHREVTEAIGLIPDNNLEIICNDFGVMISLKTGDINGT
jgi:hypothetical protein